MQAYRRNGKEITTTFQRTTSTSYGIMVANKLL